MHIFKKVRIDSLLFMSFAAFMGVLILVFTWLSYTISTHEMVDNTSYFQQDLLNELNKQLDIQLLSIEQISLAASRNITSMGYDSTELDSYERLQKQDDLIKMLANITYSTTMIHSIYYYKENSVDIDPQGPILIKDLMNLKKESWYPDLQNNDFNWIGEHQVHTVNGVQQYISFARKMYNNSGKFYGVLLLNIKAAAIEDIIRGTSGRSRILLDMRGRTLASIGNTALDLSALEKIRSDGGNSDYFHTKGITGNDMLYVWSKAHTDWILVEVTPWKDIIHGSIRLAVILVVCGIIGIFIASFFTLYVSRQFSKPISLLVSIMNLAPGKGIPSLPTDYTNEFGYLFIGYRRQMERIQELVQSLQAQHKRQKAAEILALQAMINPHFLYNTLDQLNWLAIEAGQEKISKILSLVGQMFRIGLSNGETIISVLDEITHVDCYLQIQKVRWGDSLTYSIHLDESLRYAYVPRLTFQPFVENAIIHGFHGRRSGDIRIELKVLDGNMAIHILDNGKGIHPEWEMQKGRKTGGYGIRNVKERLAAYFGQPYGISIMRQDSGGTLVTIILPIIIDKKEVEERFCVESPDY